MRFLVGMGRELMYFLKERGQMSLWLVILGRKEGGSMVKVSRSLLRRFRSKSLAKAWAVVSSGARQCVTLKDFNVSSFFR